uniref:Tetraspanin-3-like n=1 Tax=Salvator merianae TaxID=96440 RepID=A0A8D0E696_SALMN
MKRVCFGPSFNPSLLCITETWSRAFAKIVLHVLGLLLWGAALALLLGGGFVILTYKNYRLFIPNGFFLVPGYLAVMAGLFLLPTGAVAMCAPIRNSRPHQGTLMYLLLLLFCLEASSAVMIQLYSAKVEQQLKNGMDHFFPEYNWSPNHHTIDTVPAIHRQQLKCCGVYNYTDCLKAQPSSLLAGPASAPGRCCKENYLDCNDCLSQLEKLFKEGCLEKLEGRLQFVTQYVLWNYCCLFCCFSLGGYPFDMN